MVERDGMAGDRGAGSSGTGPDTVPGGATDAAATRPAADLPAASRTTRRRAALAAVTALALALVVGGVTWSTGLTTHAGTTTTGATSPELSTTQRVHPQQRSGGWRPGAGSDVPGNDLVPGDGTQTLTLETTAATATQQVGLVTIVATLGYEGAQAAGTGIVLTSDGVVLTNNHVIEGATSLAITVESTGATYSGTVVGTDVTDDVAVVRLDSATGLATAPLDTTGVAIGDAVTAIGNAHGGGQLVAAAGVVTALDAGITTRSEGAKSGQTLAGLVEIDAAVVAGDSGGAVLDAQGQVVGMTTAASSGTVNVSGYAIPIRAALDVADQIRSGVATSTVTIGSPPFLGVELAQDGTNLLTGVIAGTPAAGVGLVAGDVLTAVDDIPVATGDELAAALATHGPGDTVTVTWVRSSTGTAVTASVTLIAGPAA